jgi:glycogen operon protein
LLLVPPPPDEDPHLHTGPSGLASPSSSTENGGSAFRAYAEGLLETGTVRRGRPLPLGVELRDGGVNFAVFSRHATQIWLELYDAPDADEPVELIGLDPYANRTGNVWHVWVEGLQPGQLYGYRADGPYRPDEGHRFNPHRLLLDPYAEAITHLESWDFKQAVGFVPTAPDRDLSFATQENAGVTPKCVITQHDFDWGRDTLLKRPWAHTVIYETHVRGFTKHESSGVDHPGTYRGLVEKIPYLKNLGVTAIELMPVQEFNEFELHRENPLTGERLRNYWGYNPTSFLAPNGFYAAAGSRGQQVLEFKQMVKAFHDAGIEVLLDVVFNHTAEGHELGPTFSWRGLDNAIYYMLDEHPRYYRDYTGTGNTVNAAHPVVRDMILDALRHWVLEMHVDGFRFDLASVLGRDQDGTLLADPPLIERIAEDPILHNVKIIAEAWDAAGAYQVGSFSTGRWAEWNGHYRDDVRRFWRGDAGLRANFASRLAGSADVYQDSGRGPCSSINFVTAHDGFTLNDLVAYERKHNEANGEANRDGTNANYSANYGVEGPTTDPRIQAIRERQIKNFLLTLFVSRGVPMLLGGDEFRRTQQGNNNAYCQDNEISWFDWSRREAHSGLVRFVRELIAFRRSRPVLHADAYYTDRDVTWMNPDGATPNWDDDSARTLMMHVHGPDASDVLLLFNASTESHSFRIPSLDAANAWAVKADTSASSPHDIAVPGEEVPVDDPAHYVLCGRSSAILIPHGS